MSSSTTKTTASITTNSICDHCHTNGATPLEHCDMCKKNYCANCHPEKMTWMKKLSVLETQRKILRDPSNGVLAELKPQISQISQNQKVCKYCEVSVMDVKTPPETVIAEMVDSAIKK